ncbi:MAG: hypothetical protein ABJB61_10430, partial [bacterium]
RVSRRGGGLSFCVRARYHKPWHSATNRIVIEIRTKNARVRITRKLFTLLEEGLFPNAEPNLIMLNNQSVSR